MQPLLDAGTPVLPSSGRDVRWIIIERSTSSKWPSRSSSGLPPRNSSLPARACATRHSMSPYSSAGTAKNTTRPLSASNALASSSPIAAPISAATCALWPRAWAAPVAGSPSGCPATTRASSSPSSAKVGPSPARPGASARTPVSPRPVFGLSPSPARVSSISRAVLTSLKPSSGCLRIRSPSRTISGGIALARRLWLGGAGALAGGFAIVAVVAAAAAVHAWARRDGGVGFRHSLALAVAVYAITWASFVVLGPRGAAIFAPVWLPVLLLDVVGIGLVARLFGDVVAGRAAEAARRDAAQLRAVTLLARAAAHEINNPLTAVLGGLGLAARRLTPDSEEGKWIERAREGGERIRDIVARMNRITQVEEAPQIGALPPILDLKKSSE